MSDVRAPSSFEPMERRTLFAHIGLDLAFGDEGLAAADARILLTAADGEK